MIQRLLRKGLIIRKIIASFISIFLATIYIFTLRKYSAKIFLGEKIEELANCENDINSKRNIFDKFFTQTTLKEKVKFIINNFKKWLDE